MTHRVDCEFWVPWPVEEAFEFFGDVRRLDDLTPGWFRLIPLEADSGHLTAGAKIDYLLRWRGVPIRWQSHIRVWERPHEIVYEQSRGPFRSFRHEHFFEPEEGGTRVVDRLLYDSPGGACLRRLVVGPDLRRVLEHRKRIVTAVYS